jgi:hypothetical protein
MDRNFTQHFECSSTAYEMPAPSRPEIRTTVLELAQWASRRGQFVPLDPPSASRPPVCPCGYKHDDEPALKTAPVLAARALRTMRSNFMDQQLDCEDRQRFRVAVEAVQTFEQLPNWAQDYILKAEEGPLW